MQTIMVAAFVANNLKWVRRRGQYYSIVPSEWLIMYICMPNYKLNTICTSQDTPRKKV